MNRKIMAAFISIVTLLVVGAETSALQSQTAPSFRFQDSMANNRLVQLPVPIKYLVAP